LLTGVAIGGAAIQGLHAQAKPKAYTITELETLDAKGAANVAGRIAKTQQGAGGHNFRAGGGGRTELTNFTGVDQHSKQRPPQLAASFIRPANTDFWYWPVLTPRSLV
jgi:hypothetical protein